MEQALLVVGEGCSGWQLPGCLVDVCVSALRVGTAARQPSS